MDSNILKIYMLVQDVASSRHADGQTANILALYNQVQAKYSSRLSRLLCINSSDTVSDASILREFAPSSIVRYPLYFPENSPYAMSNGEPLSTYFQLTMEDMHAMHSLCYDLYTLEIIPALERRIEALSKYVADHRKGVRSVLRSFWRKPTENSSRVGEEDIRYRCDSSEGQTLLLADTFFILRDYEAALSTYKLLREDFKVDGSAAHFGHLCIMMTACNILVEPKFGGKDMSGILKAFREICFPGTALFHENSPYSSAIIGMALIAASMYSNTIYITSKTQLDAATLLLSAAFYTRHYLAIRRNGGAGSAYAFITALLTEKAAHCFIQMKMHRKYVFYLTLSGKTYLTCSESPNAMQHALSLLAAASNVVASENWTSLEAELLREIINLLTTRGDGVHRALFLHLYILRRKLSRMPAHFLRDNTKFISNDTFASTSFLSIMNSVDLPDVRVLPGWSTMTVVDSILRPLPFENVTGTLRSGLIVVEDLWIPLVDVEKIELLMSVNGNQLLSSHNLRGDASDIFQAWISLSREAELEYNILKESSSSIDVNKFASDLAELEDLHYMLHWHNEYSLGESVQVLIEWTNPFPSALTLTHIQLLVEHNDAISSDLSSNRELCIQPLETKSLTMSIHPLSVGSYEVCGIQWIIDGRIKVINSIIKRGELLQKTLRERSTRARREDTSMFFEVVPPKPLLQVTAEGIPDSLCDGESLKISFRISNEGNSTASSILVKIHQAVGVLLHENHLIKPEGPSRSLIRLPESVKLLAKSSILLDCIVRFDRHFLNKGSNSDLVFGLGACCCQDMLVVSSRSNRRWGLFSKSVSSLIFAPIPYLSLRRYAYLQDLKRKASSCHSPLIHQKF